MTDIVERLRKGADRVDAAMGLYPDATAMREAADEIERLRAEIEMMKEAKMMEQRFDLGPDEERYKR